MADYQLTQSGSQVQTALDKVGTTALTTTATDLSGAVNELDGDVDTNTTAISNMATSIGSLANLTTTDKTSVVNAINEINGDASNKVLPLTYATDINLLDGIFDANPTSASPSTYTFTDDGWLYVYATRGTTSGYSLIIMFDGVTRFTFPAYDAYAVVDMLIPVVSGQVLKIITDSSSATWTMRKVEFMK